MNLSTIENQITYISNNKLIKKKSAELYIRDMELFSDWIVEFIPKNYSPAVSSITNLISHYLAFLSGQNVIIPIKKNNWWSKILSYFGYSKTKLLLLQPINQLAETTIIRKKTSLNYLSEHISGHHIKRHNPHQNKGKKIDEFAKLKLDFANVDLKDYLFYQLAIKMAYSPSELQRLTYNDLEHLKDLDPTLAHLLKGRSPEELVFPITLRGLSKKLAKFQKKYGLEDVQANWKQLSHYRAKNGETNNTSLFFPDKNNPHYFSDQVTDN